jgi:hypothetical protein
MAAAKHRAEASIIGYPGERCLPTAIAALPWLSFQRISNRKGLSGRERLLSLYPAADPVCRSFATGLGTDGPHRPLPAGVDKPMIMVRVPE